MITRKIGKLLRGKATPFQIISACTLGAMIGFIPGFMNGPGLTITLLLVLVILNANLGVALLTGAIAKILSLLLLPASFAVGRLLMDGPLEALFRWIINTPVLALFGFDHYATTGGVVLGAIFGVAVGFALSNLVRRFRRRMAGVEERSERYQKWSSKWWVRALAWLIIGPGHGKRTYAQLLERRVGNPVRPLGVAFAVLLVVLLVIVYQFASGPVVQMAMQRGLERANGATVDIEDAELDLSAGKLRVAGLAMADPNALDEDLLRAREVEADIGAADLLRKRLTFDRLVLRDATSGEKRARPGKLVGKLPQPAEPEPDAEKTIEDYIDQANQWKQRLAQLRDWLERLSGPPDEDSESWQERLKRRAEELGYGRVIAQHLIDEVPSVTVLELEADGIRVAQLEGEVLDVRGRNLSTHPALLAKKPQLTVTSRSGNLSANLLLAGAQTPDEQTSTDQRNAVQFTWLGVPVQSVQDSLRVGGDPLLSGGTFDIDIDGNWSQKGVGYINLPLVVTLHDTTITAPGAKASKVQKLVLPIGLRGPFDNPTIMLDDRAMVDALVAAGADELAGRARAELREKVGDVLGDKVGDDVKKRLGDDVGGAIEGLLGGGKENKDDGEK